MINYVPTPRNTSGEGSDAIVPQEIKGWNWGAFFLTWIWAIRNRVWIGILSLLFQWWTYRVFPEGMFLVPFALGIIMATILGAKGNEWAWKHRRWESDEQFERAQTQWAIRGRIVVLSVILFCVCLYFLIIALWGLSGSG
jgi:hypothetical protein